MRSFKGILKTVGVFLLAVSLLSAFFIACYLKGENFHYQDAREREALRGKLDFLACGASYTLFGIRPDILDADLGVHSYDLAGTLMTLRGRYVLLEQELARNPVKTVILEVSPDTLLRDRGEEGPKGDLPMLGRITDSDRRWSYFREAFFVKEWPEIYYDMTSKGMESALRLLQGSYETENRIMSAGYYVNTKPDTVIPDNYRELFHTQSLPELVLEENLAWLEKLVALCQAHGAEVYLISTPQSEYYNCLYANLDYYQMWFTDFAASHGLPYYNFNLAKNKLELLPDRGCFYDDAHLNTQGGEIFTHMLAEVLQNDRQGRDSSDEFYASYKELSEAAGY